MLAEALDANWPVLQFVSHGRQVDGEDPETPLGLMRDLERTCSCCGHKAECAQDLAVHPESKASPGSKAWKKYCPNAISLDRVVGARSRFPA